MAPASSSNLQTHHTACGFGSYLHVHRVVWQENNHGYKNKAIFLLLHWKFAPSLTLSSQTSQPISSFQNVINSGGRAETMLEDVRPPDPSSPCIVGIHSQSLPHAGDVLLQCRVCQCLQGHAVGFMEVPSIFCQAVTQIILMEFQNSCKAPESGGYFCRARTVPPAAV